MAKKGGRKEGLPYPDSESRPRTRRGTHGSGQIEPTYRHIYKNLRSVLRRPGSNGWDVAHPNRQKKHKYFH